MKVSTTHPLARTGLDCAVERFRSSLSQPILEGHVRYELDAPASELVIVSLEETPQGEIGRYRGTARFGYGKVQLGLVLPNVIAATLAYPTTFRLLKQWLMSTYGILLEEGEFAISTAPTHGLAGDDLIDVVPGASNSVVSLIALPASGRWVAGSTLRLQVVGNVTKTHLNDLVSVPIALDMARLTHASYPPYYVA